AEVKPDAALPEEVHLVVDETEAEIPAIDGEPALAVDEEETGIPTPEPYRLGVDVLLEEVDEEQLPSVDGELVEGSIGWVQVEPEEDYYSGWSVGEDRVEDEFEWVRDESEEDQEEYRKPAKKKRGKRTSKPEYFDDQPRDSRKDKGRGRSRGW
ncbi:MAG TPA: hypothetical protein VLY63_12240, partial [Anaerolineae bacterium]|nr:hypothetical protein [Anaerolineae bacterium]